jgi:hypothetical protein
LLNFNRVFVILNANPDDIGEGRQAYVYVVDKGAGADSVKFYRGTDINDSIEGRANAVRLDAGESTAVGFAIDTSNEEVTTGDLQFEVTADVSEIAEAVFEVDNRFPTVGEPITFNATRSTGDELEYQYDFDDGTLTADAGSTTTHIYDEIGTYNVTLTVAETAQRAPNGSDTTTRRVIVFGVPQTGGPGEEFDLSDRGSELQSLSVDPDTGTSGDFVVRSIAAESVADVANDTPPTGSPVIGGADITLASNPDIAATVTVQVNASAVPAGVDPNDLAVERYNGTAWQVLPTAVQSTTANTITLVAETPGFSPFAVTVNSDAPAPDDGGDSPDAPDDGDDRDAPDDADDDADEPATPESPTDTPESPTDTPESPTATPEPPTATPESPTATPEDGDTPTDDDGVDDPDDELGGIGLLPTLGIAALLVVLAALAVIRIRRQE